MTSTHSPTSIQDMGHGSPGAHSGPMQSTYSQIWPVLQSESASHSLTTTSSQANWQEPDSHSHCPSQSMRGRPSQSAACLHSAIWGSMPSQLEAVLPMRANRSTAAGDSCISFQILEVLLAFMVIPPWGPVFQATPNSLQGVCQAPQVLENMGDYLGVIFSGERRRSGLSTPLCRKCTSRGVEILRWSDYTYSTLRQT